MRFKLSHFQFDVPQKLIPQSPNEQRDESKLMVLHKSTGEIEHKLFKNLIDYFDEEDVVVFNNTKVFPARMYGNKEKTHFSFMGNFLDMLNGQGIISLMIFFKEKTKNLY